jgi:hypothetical protein
MTPSLVTPSIFIDSKQKADAATLWLPLSHGFNQSERRCTASKPIPWRFHREPLTAFRQVPSRDKQGSSIHRMHFKGCKFTIKNKERFNTLKNKQWNAPPPTTGFPCFPAI